MSDPLAIRTPSEPSPAGPPGAPAELDAYARSAIYCALALGFGPPGPAVRRRLASAPGAEALSQAFSAAGLEDLGAETAPGGALSPAARPPREAAHRRLFGHTVRGSVPPYGTEYGADGLFQQPHQLADIAGFFAAFGLVVDPSCHERVDHVCCQLEFSAFLARKEAHARELADAAMMADVQRAQKLFLRDHLGRMAPAFGERLRREEGAGFYAALGAILRRFVEAECERHGVAAGPENLVLRPDADFAVPMACGGGAECGSPAGCGDGGPPG